MTNSVNEIPENQGAFSLILPTWLTTSRTISGMDGRVQMVLTRKKHFNFIDQKSCIAAGITGRRHLILCYQCNILKYLFVQHEKAPFSLRICATADHVLLPGLYGTPQESNIKRQKI